MSGGTFNVSRTIWTHPAFADEPFSEREAFMWMIGEGGSVATTIRGLATRWQWSLRRVAQFLRKMERRGLVCISGAGSLRVVTAAGSSPIEEPKAMHLPSAGSWRGNALPASTRKRILDRDGKVCRWCGATDGPWHIDHIKAVAKGGKDADANLCVSCAPCNLAKGTKAPEEWLQ